MCSYFVSSVGVGGLERFEPISVFWNPYLTRLRIEGVSFTSSASLGITFLFLASLVWRYSSTHPLSFDREGSDIFSTLLDDLFAHPSMQQSVEEAKRYCIFGQRDNQYVECKIDAARRDFVSPLGMPELMIVNKKYVE